eukprot:6013048-Pleurochrysis_carterae.AAC.1
MTDGLTSAHLRRLRRDGRVVLVRGSEVAVVPVRGVVRAGQAPRVLGRLEEKSRCIEHRFVVSVARAELDAAHETSCDLTVGGHLERVGLHPLDPGISHLGGDQIERGHVRLHCSDEVAERRSEHLTKCSVSSDVRAHVGQASYTRVR